MAVHLGAGYRVAVGVLRPLMMLATRRDWHGAEHLPRSGGFVVAPNHISHVDPIVVAHFLHDNGCPPRFLTKSGLFTLPVIGWVLRSAGQIPVFRESRNAAAAFSGAVAAVEAGECVTIYPEGTLTRDPALWPMVSKTGAARVALTTGCPVIPIAHWGAQRILAPYTKRPHLLGRHVMHVMAGPAVDLDDLRGRPITSDLLRIATERIMADVRAQVAELRREIAPTEIFDARAAGLTLMGRPQPTGERTPATPTNDSTTASTTASVELVESVEPHGPGPVPVPPTAVEPSAEGPAQ